MISDWLVLSLVEWVLLALLLLVFLIQLFYYLFYYRGVLRQSRGVASGKLKAETEQPPVTIILCARDQAHHLESNLTKILEQDYPEFQVVVVNDASCDETENLLLGLEKKYSNLYHTFVPEGVQSVSAKKMAMTIGIKAAKYDLLLFTEPNCVPNSSLWIASMMSHFDANCGIVLGYSSYSKITGFLKYLISYDTLFTALQFMGFAAVGKSYMGLGRNMAYRKDLFFNNRGFASHLYLHSGEDDLFIGEVANKNNTRIEVSPDSFVNTIPTSVWWHWKAQKINHIATSSYYKIGTKLRTATELVSRYLFYTLTVTLFIIGIVKLNSVLLSLAGVLFIVRYGVQLLIINRSAKCLNETRYYFSIPVFDILLPIINVWFRITKMFHKENTFTWQVLH